MEPVSRALKRKGSSQPVNSPPLKRLEEDSQREASPSRKGTRAETWEELFDTLPDIVDQVAIALGRISPNPVSDSLSLRRVNRQWLDAVDKNSEVWEEAKVNPLHWACWYGDIEAVKRLLAKRKFDIDCQSKFDGFDQLLKPIQPDDADQVCDKQTPLHFAVFRGHFKIAKILIEAGADLEAQDRWNRSPLTYAAWQSNHKISKLLLDHGAAVDGPKENEYKNEPYGDMVNVGTPLMWCLCSIYSDPDPAVVTLLLKRGAQANPPNDDNTTALEYAEMAGNTEVAKILKKYGGY